MDYDKKFINQIISLTNQYQGYLDFLKEKEKRLKAIELEKEKNSFIFQIQDVRLLNALSQLNKTSKNVDFKAVKENEMPPKISFEDGSFRTPKGRNCLEYRFMHNGTQVPVTGRNKEECFLKRFEIMSGKRQIKTKTNYTLMNWLEKWNKNYNTKKNGEIINKDYRSYVKKFEKFEISKKPLIKILGVDIQNFLNEYENRKNIQKKYFVFLNAVLKLAKGNQLIKYNPCEAVKLESYEVEHYNVIQPHEQNLILEAIRAPKYKAMFWFLCCTGLRHDTAIKAIQTVDFENNLIISNKKNTKTKNHKTQIPFLPEYFTKNTVELLKQVTYDGSRNYFKKLFKKLGLDVVIHSCRKVFASCARAAGFEFEQIQAWLCHKTLATTTDLYTKLIDGNSPIVEYFVKLYKKFNPKN